MMRSIFVGLAAFAVVVVAGPASAQNMRTAPNAAAIGTLQLDSTPAAAQSSVTRIYVVQMDGDAASSYQGGVSGYARTAPDRGSRYDARASHVQMYAGYLERRQDQVLDSVNARDRKVYSYRHAFNGFAARLTAEEAQKLSGNKAVLQVWEDREMSLDTNNSPAFLGLLDRKEGLRSRHHLRGENVVIGIIDSGAIQEHPSFSDTKTFPLPRFCDKPAWWNKRLCDFLEAHRTVRVYGPPRGWNGTCQAGEAWAESDCNNKLIGARWFADGFLAAYDVLDGEFLSARDSDGHGSHTASTAGGNEVTASLGGTPLAEISGMAPRARLAIYKACWQRPNSPNPGSSSCFFSDSAAATDAAVADGVDVINFSVGTAVAFNDPQDLAFLDAAAAGVFIARSAGNSGPTSSAPGPTAAGEPWVTSVAASTMDGKAFALAARINSPASVAGSYPALEGAITKPLALSGPITNDVVAASSITACVPIADVGGKIALIARGACAFTVKMENAALANASAVLMYTSPATNPKTVMGGTTTPLTSSIPGVMIDNAPGVAILAALTGGATVNATLSAGTFVTETLTGNIMAGFSSRGPYPTETDWIKPDITAPGVRILAAGTPEPAIGGVGGFFQYLQGTSMSSPHIAGLAALVREEHPSWSPAAVKSALMTTARQNVVKEDGATPAGPFDFGAGHVDPNKAIDPGLVYEADLFDYLAASCGTVSPLVSEADCGFLETVGLSLNPADLNLPSIGIGALPGSQTIRRTVTNVGDDDKRGSHRKYGSRSGSYYKAEIVAPEGFTVEVSPDRLWLRPGDIATYEVTITNVSAPPGEWRFGSLTWKDDSGHEVRSPIAVNAVALVAPEAISGTGADGATSFDVTFGFSGAYTAAAHGLEEPWLTLGEVEDDPGNSFEFLGDGTAIAYFAELPAGTAYAQWSLYNEYIDGNHDLDLYLYYCPRSPTTGNLTCSPVDSSGNFDSNESVSLTFPLSDDAIDDPYVVFVHGYGTEGGLPAQFVLFDWAVGPDLGNMTVSGPSTATVGQTAQINVNWAGLPTGAGEKQLGAVSHSDATGIKGLTIVNITNDDGEGFCSFPGLCTP